jgi:tetrahydromethanopterin S-methyltransferase subunit A
MICNIVANPNIRYLVVGGPESEGHLTGEALKALHKNGVDEKRKILGTEAPHPVLFNVPLELIERFRRQLTIINLQFEDNPDIVRQAVWSCYQENPVGFRGCSLYDSGAYPEPPLSGKLTWRVFQPWAEPEDEKEQEALKKAKQLMERIRAKKRE